MIKYIWIITVAICTIYKSKCPKECEVTIDHNHLISVCRDSLVAIKDKKEMIEFYKKNFQNIKKVDSVKVN